MAFGRLDVYWPDGPIEIYQLEKPTIGIGRQRGNDIILETEAISRYHAKMHFQDGQCRIEDLGSVNGTYVDGIRLEPNEPCKLLGGEELQIGDVRAIYHPPADSELTTATSAAAETQVLEVVKPTFRVALEGVEQTVTPGMHVTSQLLIENLGAQSDRYFVEVDGIPKEWVRVNAHEVVLEAEQSARISISIKLPRRSDSTAGTYLVNLHVRAGSRPAQTVSAEMSLLVLSFYAFGMRLGDGPVDLDVPFPVHIHNQGNVAMEVDLRGEDPLDALRFDFQPSQLNLQPGQRVSVMTKIGLDRARRPQRADAQAFTVVASNHGPAGWQAAVPGWVRVPDATGWGMLTGDMSPFMIGAALVGLVAVALVLVLLLFRPAPPQIVADPVITSPSDRAPLAGDDLVLVWEAQNASEILLQVIRNGEQSELVALPGDVQQYSYPLSNAGQYKFVLTARAGDQTDGGELLLAVQPAIVHFDADPTNLVQGIQETLTLWWETRGATGVEIVGLAELLCSPLEDVLDSQGPQTFQICPHTSGTATLRVVARAEGVPEQSGAPLEISIDKAMCLVLSDGARLYLPGAVSGEPHILPSGAVVQVQARDPSDAWMLVTTQTGGLTGWLQRDEAVDCGDIDLLNLMVNNQVALPAPTPTVTTVPTATVTPTALPTVTSTPTATPAPTELEVNSGR